MDGAFILVPSTLKALQDIAAFYRLGFDIPFVGITGSVGKTTAKEMVSSVLFFVSPLRLSTAPTRIISSFGEKGFTT